MLILIQVGLLLQLLSVRVSVTDERTRVIVIYNDIQRIIVEPLMHCMCQYNVNNYV